MPSVDTVSVRFLYSSAAFEERIFFLQPLASNESFGFGPGMFITEIGGLWRESLQYHRGKRETN